MNERVIVTSNCERCDQHKTELGLLLDIKNTVEKEFELYDKHDQMQMIIAWFNNFKLDERTRLIQGYKKENIKKIGEERK